VDPYTVEDIKDLLLYQEEHFDKYKIADPAILQANFISIYQ